MGMSLAKGPVADNSELTEEWVGLKSEIRTPEIRKKAEIRIPK